MITRGLGTSGLITRGLRTILGDLWRNIVGIKFVIKRVMGIDFE